MINSLNKARRPENLISGQQVVELKNFISNQLTVIMEGKVDKSRFCWLRSLIVSRLTLFNARRGDEPSRILLSQWDDALHGVWLPQDQVETIDDEAEKYLTGRFKLAYIHGKGKKFVPVLIPDDMVKAVNILVEDRQLYGIQSDNHFLFPTKNGVSHCSGWHAVRDVCQKAGIAPINATDQRHYVSTIYASLDMSAEDRKVYLRHMGHEESTSVLNYQTPFGFKELRIMAPLLTKIDQGMCNFDSE